MTNDHETDHRRASMAPRRRAARRLRAVGRISWVLAVVVGAALSGCLSVLGPPLMVTSRAGADGPAPCSQGGPPDPFFGYCATYSGRNTYYGSYGPGFPTPTGWGFCAANAATGGSYPEPGYGYVPSGAPPGALTANLDPLGFALSQAQAAGWWTAGQGPSDPTDFAAAGKILFDEVVWGQEVPAMPYGTLNAFNDLNAFYVEVAGATGPPVLTMANPSPGSTFSGSTVVQLHVQFPGSDAPTKGLGVVLSVSGGTFNSSGGPSTIGVATDSGGNVSVALFAPNPGAVTVDAVAAVGQVGVGFYHSSNAAAQDLAALASPVSVQSMLSLTDVAPVATTGTLSIQKVVDDPAYYGPAGALFDIEGPDGVLQTLTTDSEGNTAETGPLPVGTDTVHESVAPDGYTLAPDQEVTFSAGQNTVVSYRGPTEEHVQPTEIVIMKGTEGAVSTPLAGAVFDLRYDQFDNGTFGDDLGTCTPDETGSCLPPGNDGPGNQFLPGNYQVTEIQAPAGYSLSAPTTITKFAGPDSGASFSFSDSPTDSIEIEKTGDDPNYDSVIGAVFTLTGPLPSTTTVATLTIAAGGQSNIVGNLLPGSYTLTETSPPTGYQAVAPQTVSLPEAAGGSPGTVTVIDVMDHVQPASATIQKLDAQTKAPLAGATFDVRFDPDHSGQYTVDLGDCTTGAGGTCVPPGNDANGELLPGDYQITEITPPPGYALGPSAATQEVTLTPGATGEFTFTDSILVPARFQKVATGNFNPDQVSYAGAVISVRAGSLTGSEMASCTTDPEGACVTAAALTSGQTYCWLETTAPVGLSPGASGCFVADNGQGAQPITVSDAGQFVAVAVKKVAEADPTLYLPDAVFDLYRVDGGHGPDAPAPPEDAASEAGQTWVARATTDNSGTASFPLQFPGYAYCAVEQAAPANYQLATGERCTQVLVGSTATPPALTTIVMADAAAITLAAHKFNSLLPGTGIPGATYDLFVEGHAPPGTDTAVPTDPPPAAELGDTWYARATSDASGNLRFAIPAGYAWCLLEVRAPQNYLVDQALHCTATLTTSSPAAAASVALPETLATVFVSAHKFNSLDPSTAVPGARYELLAVGSAPPGPPAGPPPTGVTVPAGDTYWTVGTTDTDGQLSFGVPAGYSSWCLKELAPIPAGYVLDTSLHCSAVLNTTSPPSAMTLALPEVPVPGGPPQLAFTGGPGLGPLWVGLGMVLAGALLRRSAGARAKGDRSGGG